MNSNQFSTTIIGLTKWLLFLCFSLLTIFSISKNSFIGFVSFLICAFLLLPTIQEKRMKWVPKIESFLPKTLAIITLFIIGQASVMSKNNSNARLLKHDEAIELVEEYIQANKNETIFRNLELIHSNFSLFSNQYIAAPWKFNFDNLLIEGEKKKIIYCPFKFQDLQSNQFLSNISQKGIITDYQIDFNLNDKNQILNHEAVVFYGDSIEIWTPESSMVDLSKYLLTDAIKAQEKIREARIAKSKSDSEKNVNNELFKSKCLSAWDGSCRALEEVVKKNLKDPESYEHIETVFWNMDSHAVVAMKYRAKNSFGGFVIGNVKAKISWSCELIEIIESN